MRVPRVITPDVRIHEREHRRDLRGIEATKRIVGHEAEPEALDGDPAAGGIQGHGECDAHDKATGLVGGLLPRAHDAQIATQRMAHVELPGGEQRRRNVRRLQHTVGAMLGPQWR